MTYSDDEIKEFEILPIGAAFSGRIAKEVLQIEPEWCLRPEVQQMYNELRSFKTPFELYQAHANEPLYLEAVQKSLDISDEMLIGFIRALKQRHAQKKQTEIIGKLIVAQDDQEKLILINTLRTMIGHSDSGLQTVDLSQPCPPLEFLLKIDEVGLIAKKAICAIKAKAKNGKSHLCAILAAALSGGGECLGIQQVGQPHKVLYVDTEQEMPSTEYIAKHIHRLNGWDLHQNCNLLQVVNVRRVKASERLAQIEGIITSGRIEVLVVDGIKDLVYDINDTVEATRIMDELMRLIELHNIALITVIHENKGDSKDMRGHLGTELLNKCYEVYEVSKDKDNDLFKVVCTDRRGRDISDWAFAFDENDQLIRVDVPVEIPKKSQREQKDEQIKNIVRTQFEEQPQVSQMYMELANNIQKFSEVSAQTSYRYIKKAVEMGVIGKSADGRYYLIQDTPFISPSQFAQMAEKQPF